MRNIGKWVGTAICLLLLFADATMARNFHPGSVVRQDISTAVGQIGGQLPDFTLPDMNGNQVTLSHFYGKGPILLTFDRSLDW
jgi:cytochrome oxidase Cu insertion factor (SCO1/SenC/PrrC family)